MKRTKTCECACGCTEPATEQDDSGAWVCSECADYYVDNDGDVVCSREQTEGTCRHCDEQIQWGAIRIGQPGVSNWREGTCSCRRWRQTDRGGTWVMSEEGRGWCSGCGEEISLATAHWHDSQCYCDVCEEAPSDELLDELLAMREEEEI